MAEPDPQPAARTPGAPPSERRRGGWRAAPAALVAAAGVAALVLLAAHSALTRPAAARQAPAPVRADGYRIDDERVIRHCGSCHVRDEDGRMGRLSYMRKTPEGWQTSMRRMVGLHNVRITAEDAREIVRYLSNHQGLAPEELAPGRFEVERRMIDFKYASRETEQVCNACHSMGRVITQHRTKDEWKLLIATHRALYPFADFQAFHTGPPPYPVEKAVDQLAAALPLETAAWTAWSANVRPPRLEGSWVLTGHDPAKGPFHGTMVVRAVAGRDDEFETESSYVYVEGGSMRRSGRGVVYTGHQWRGRSAGSGGSDERREVLSVERGWAEMSGRWFTGDYDEDGLDITLRRAVTGAMITGVHPRGLRTGAGNEIRIYGANLPTRVAVRDVDFGPGVRVTAVVRAAADVVTLRVEVAADAALGTRDLVIGGVPRTDAVAIYDRVHTVRVLPNAGMARVGGVLRPKQYQQFEAVAYHNGRDGRPGTEDDVLLGRVPVSWSIEEYPVTHDDNDVLFIGAIDAGGRFTPALDGPNPERSLNRNNIGDAWVVARHDPGDGPPIRGRAHLLVTVPNYMQWDPWPTGDVNRARINEAVRPPNGAGGVPREERP